MSVWLGLMAAAATATAPAAAPSYFTPGADNSAARNQCRVDCGDAWVKASVCKADLGAVVAVKPLVCQKRADKAYDVCLAACADPAYGAAAVTEEPPPSPPARAPSAPKAGPGMPPQNPY